jgi:hypothetical protein
MEKRQSSNANLERDVIMRTEVELTDEQREKILKENWSATTQQNPVTKHGNHHPMT